MPYTVMLWHRHSSINANHDYFCEMSLFTSGCENWYSDDLKDPIIMLIKIIEGNGKELYVFIKKRKCVRIP